MQRNLKAIGPALTCVCLFLLVISLSVIQTAREADRVDSEHSQASVQMALALRAERIGAFAAENAKREALARAVYGSGPNRALLDAIFAPATLTGDTYDAVYLIDAQGQLIYGIKNGQRTLEPPQARFGDVIGRLTTDLGGSPNPVSTAASDGSGLSLIGASNVVPADYPVDRLVPTDGSVRLVMTGRVTPAMLGDISSLLQLSDLMIRRSPVGRSATIADRWGRPVAQLSWTQPRHIWVTLQRTLPVISVALLGALIVLGLLYRQGLRIMSKLKRLAMTDPLTGLPNRRALFGRLAEACSTQRQVALAILNIDGFKRINDQFGHEVGDSVLSQSAAELQRLRQRGFWIARLGGDEFALVVSGDDAEARMNRAAGRVLAFVNKPLRVDDRTIAVAASLGLALGRQGDDPIELARRADVALHAAKAEGRRRANWFDSRLDETRATHRAIENDLRKGIEASELYLLYQPLYTPDGQTMVGVEALLRWCNSDRGEVSPEVFVPVAEESGLIDKIGLLALHQACVDACRWPDLKVAVNISAAQLRSPGFVRSVARTLAETGLPPGRLELEITETFIVADPEQAARVLAELRGLGLTLALDDFGAGFASIGFLRRYQFGKLKIDRSLIANVEHSESSRAILQATVTIARALKMGVTAEGIETKAQATLLRIVGCDHVQGWLFDRAMTADQIDERRASLQRVLRQRA